MLTIDGSLGEGGGQILRSALALSMVTGTPFRLENIRAGRPKPGLLRQHLTAVNAAAEICGARLTGTRLHSRELTFVPGAVRPGDYRFSIGTAGSTTLVLQTVLPPLLTASAPSTLVLEGGTHNPHAPPFDFIDRAFLPLINRMGPRVIARLERYGFFPAGGGQFSVEIESAPELTPLRIMDRGEIRTQRSIAVLAGLPRHIGERENKTVAAALNWPLTDTEIREAPADQGPGNILLLEIESEHVTEVFTGFGKRGVRSEDVGRAVADDVKAYLAAGVPVGTYLADQLLLPFALAGGGVFSTLALSRHTSTNIEIIQMFLNVRLNVRLSVTSGKEDQWLVKIWDPDKTGCVPHEIP